MLALASVTLYDIQRLGVTAILWINAYLFVSNKKSYSLKQFGSDSFDLILKKFIVKNTDACASLEN